MQDLERFWETMATVYRDDVRDRASRIRTELIAPKGAFEFGISDRYDKYAYACAYIAIEQALNPDILGLDDDSASEDVEDLADE